MEWKSRYFSKKVATNEKAVKVENINLNFSELKSKIKSKMNPKHEKPSIDILSLSSK